MSEFGSGSRSNLKTCHPDLIKIAEEVIKSIDHSITEGHRGREKQNQAFKDGNSKVEYPNGMHNTWPSLALDFVPWPFNWKSDWNDKARFREIWEAYKAEGKRFDIELRWGGSWGWDSPHIELVSKEGIAYKKTFKQQ
jgi:peptidoglycan L-alanyl-D-glutamate endopeptidase CwlK